MRSAAKLREREIHLVPRYWQTALNWGANLPEFRIPSGDLKTGTAKKLGKVKADKK